MPIQFLTITPEVAERMWMAMLDKLHNRRRFQLRFPQRFKSANTNEIERLKKQVAELKGGKWQPPKVGKVRIA